MRKFLILFVMSISVQAFGEGGPFGYITSYIRDPLRVGSVTPSSQSVVERITKYVQISESNPRPINILEAGAGDGVITHGLVKKLRPQDRLDVIELESVFCKQLNHEFKDISNVHIHCISVFDWHPNYQYDYIISTLPLNAFSFAMAKEILNRFKDQFLTAEGVLSHLEYPGFTNLKLWYLSVKDTAKKKDFREKRTFINDFFSNSFEKSIVLKNIPPGRIYHIKFNKADPDKSVPNG